MKYKFPTGWKIINETEDFIFLLPQQGCVIRERIQELYTRSKEEGTWEVFSVLTGEVIVRKV